MTEPATDPRTGGGEDWLHPSPRLATLRRTEVAAATLAVGLTAGTIAAIWWTPVVVAVAVGVVLVLGVASDVLVQRRVRAWAYAEREDDLLVRRGLLVRRLSVVPYGRMQFVDVTAGPAERPFALATVRLHTAAAASDARIPGLDREVAHRLRDQLATLGESRAAGL